MNEIDEIKERLPIEEVVGSYIKLEKAGSNLKARCPFHNEKTPSFFVSPDKRIFKCFGCGVSGDIFTFVEKYEGIDFNEALKKLAQQAGVELKNQNYQKSEPKKPLYDLLNEVTLFWQKELLKNEEVKNYLKKRGLNGEMVKKFRLGFAPDKWDYTLNYLYQRGYSLEDIEKVGLIKKGEQGKWYDRFRNRIIFPIFDLEGRVVAFSGRDFSGSDKVAKYLNSPETILFNKSKILYGLNFAKNEARRRGYFILGEGQFDLIMAHKVGFENMVVTSGTSLTDEHLELLNRYSNKLILAFDSDSAGIKASYRALIKALNKDFDIKIIDMEEGKDPADTILESEAKWKNMVANAKNWLEFFIDKILIKNTNEKEKISEMEEKILPYLKLIKDPILKGKYISKIAKGFEIKEEFVLEALEKSPKAEVKTEIKQVEKELDIFEKKGKIENRENLIIKELFAIYLWQKEKPLEQRWVENLDDLIELIPNEQWKKINGFSDFKKDQLVLEVEVKYESSTPINLKNSTLSLKEELKKIYFDKEIEELKILIKTTQDFKEKEKYLLKLQNLLKEKHNYGQSKN